jgi:hypothetical protein
MYLIIAFSIHSQILLCLYDSRMNLLGQSLESVNEVNAVDFHQAPWAVSGTFYYVGGDISAFR